MTHLTLSTSVITPTGRRGIILQPPGGTLMPLHCLVQFPEGECWVLASILAPADAHMVPLGWVAVELARLAWRGVVAYSPGDPICYLPWQVLDGEALTLANKYDAFQEWILADMIDPMNRALVLPLNAEFPSIQVPPGATPADVAAAVLKDNQQVANRFLSHLLPAPTGAPDKL